MSSLSSNETAVWEFSGGSERDEEPRAAWCQLDIEGLASLDPMLLIEWIGNMTTGGSVRRQGFEIDHRNLGRKRRL